MEYLIIKKGGREVDINFYKINLKTAYVSSIYQKIYL